jgi:hypothetical protein
MTERINLERLSLKNLDQAHQREMGSLVQKLVQIDFLRAGVSPEDVNLFADPENPVMVDNQIEKIASADKHGNTYIGVRTDETGDELRGIIKLGRSKKGDMQPFGTAEVLSVYTDTLRLPSYRSQELQAFSVDQQELVAPTLAALREDEELLSPFATLKAAIHPGDNELDRAFTILGAPKDGPKGIIELGRHGVKYAAEYTLRKIPPKR